MLNELQGYFDTIQKHQSWFIETAETIKEKHKPLGKDEWSIAEILEHLVVVERYLLASFEAATERISPSTLSQKIRKKVVALILSNGIKVPVPVERVIPTGRKDLGELVTEWKELRVKLHELLNAKKVEDLQLLGLRHPRAGDLTIPEALYFTDRHLTYHMLRLKRLLRKQRQKVA